jgi:signal transduction histidine kinase
MKHIGRSRDGLLRGIFSAYMRRAVSFILGFLCLALLISVEIALVSIIWPKDISLLAVALVGISSGILAPFIWWLGRVMTNRLPWPEIAHSNRLTHQLSVVNERYKELDALKEQFISTASHELRTSLTTVQGYVELLCEHHDMLTPEMQADFLKKARAGCDELNLMVNNMLDANLIHDEVAAMQLYPVSLRLAMLHVLEMLNASIQRERRSITIYIESDFSVFADDRRLRQILLNLVSNAIKYSAAGTRIDISAVQDNMDIHISVRDYGLGIPPGEQRHLFERFTRLERDLNSSVRGSGLGLYICDRFVNAMGGRIWIESSGVPGEGCTFTFVLRCAPLDQVQPVEVVELPA